MCLRIRQRTVRVIGNISSRRNYSSQALRDDYGDRSCESTEIYRNPARRDSWECDYRPDSYSFTQASCLQHWFKNWQEQRKYRLTASTFAGAIGFWPRRRVQLWLEKIGYLDPFPGNMATLWNNIKEEEALEKYKLITGNEVMLSKFHVYGNQKREEDWLGASPDGIVDNLYVWTPNGSSLFRLYRDAAYWLALKVALDDFWWVHVRPARELYRGAITDPLSQLHYLKPAPRHELCSYIVYESKRIVDNSKLMFREIHGERQN